MAQSTRRIQEATHLLVDSARSALLSGDDERARYLYWQVVMLNDAQVTIAARKYAARGTHTYEDALQTARLGCYRAATKFEPDRGFLFTTMAAWWIRAALTKELPEVYGVSSGFRETARLARQADRVGLSRDRVEGILGKERLQRAEELVARAHTTSIDAPVDDGGELLANGVPDQSVPTDQSDPIDRAKVLHLVGRLPEPTRTVIEKHFGLRGGDGSAIVRVAHELGWSREKCRKHVQSGLQKLREEMASCLD